MRLYQIDMLGTPSVAEIETAARDARLTISEMCRRAGTAPSTFNRWRVGANSPSINIVQRWIDVIMAIPRLTENGEAN